MRKRHQKIPIYELILIFHVGFPPQGTNLIPVIIVLLYNLVSVLLPIIINHDTPPPPSRSGSIYSITFSSRIFIDIFSTKQKQ